MAARDDDSQIRKLTRLTPALRHPPKGKGSGKGAKRLLLRKNGCARVADVMQHLEVTQEAIETEVRTSIKNGVPRYELIDDPLVRATEGHTISYINTSLSSMSPTDVLMPQTSSSMDVLMPQTSSPMQSAASGSDDLGQWLQKRDCEKLKQSVAETQSRHAQNRAIVDVMRAELDANRAKLDACKAELGVIQEQIVQAKSSPEYIKQGLTIIAPLPLPFPSQCRGSTLTDLCPDDPVHCFLSSLFINSLAQHRKELRSPEFCPAPELEICKIQVNMNQFLVKQYLTRAEGIQVAQRNDCSPIPELMHLKIPARRGSLPDWPDLNEHFAFHGALEKVVEEICFTGFDPRRGGEGVGKLFGLATYFAANASKSDIYTEDWDNRLHKTAERKIIIARTLLGESGRTAKCMSSATRPTGRRQHSMWADILQNGGCVDHHEIMIYDNGQAYPEFIVTYKHTSSCACAQCLKRVRPR